MSIEENHDERRLGEGHREFTGPSAPIPRPAHLAAFLLLPVVLAVLNAVPIQAQAAPTTAGSGNEWTPAVGGSDNGTGAAGVTPETLTKLTITATRDTIYGGLEDLRFELKRDSTGEAMNVKLWLHQDENWLTRSTQTRHVYFYPWETTAVLRVHRSQFNPDVSKWGCIIAKVVEVDGNDYSAKKVRAGVWVISSPDPLVKLFVGRDEFAVGEDGGQPSGTHVVAVMADGMPRGVSLTAGISTRGKGSQSGLSATPGRDYEPRIRTLTIDESSFERYDDTWVGGGDFDVPILDDDLREGDEVFEVVLEADPEFAGLVQYTQFRDWTDCDPGCAHRVLITDDEEVPAMDLSVSADEIMEEGETSSVAMVSITDDVRFEHEQLLTFGLAGTATMDADYAVSPSDADNGMPGYQVVLPAQAASVGLTLKAMSDEVDDPNEKIEVSAALDGEGIGDMQSVGIMNQELPLPKISVAANRDTIIGSMEDLVLTLSREDSGERLRLSVRVAQDQHWLPWTSCPVTFEAGSATASVTIPHGTFSSDVVQSGRLTLTVDPIVGYDTDKATVTVYVVSQEGPAVRVFFDQDTYRFGEDRDDATAVLIAETAPGMPRGTTISFSMVSRSGTAIADEDFKGVSRQMTLREEDFSFRNGSWQVRRPMPVTLLDDEVREGDETCDLVLEKARGAQADLGLRAVTPVDITDDEDIPQMELRLSADEIEEEGETSSVATVSIANGKTFATDRWITFALGGSAALGADYRVSPADADESASGHQVVLPAGSETAKATFTAQDDNVEDPDEEIRISASHDGHAIGDGSIGIREPVPGPAVRVTFEGVQATSESGVDGVATGPFKSRFTFSERVEGFTKDDIHWSTRAWTTEDSTAIGIFLWNFTEVRSGLEYTTEMMPTQKGEVYIGVRSDRATSAATGAGNEWGGGSLRVEFPRDRMLVAPAAVTVREGDSEGAFFAIVLTSEPSADVTVKVSGMEGTAVSVDWPEIEIKRKFWRSGRAVDVTAGQDANTSNETVTLKVSSSGGGYDGRDANVVVNVIDDDAASMQGMSSDEALTLVDDVTPDEAAAALFGEGDLSDSQLDALDQLGNRNGDYDLGDLLSWIERCRNGGADCGTGSAGSAFGAGAALPAAGTGGQGGGSSQRNRGGNRSAPRARKRGRRVRSHAGRSWYGLALMLFAGVTWACADDGLQPSVTERDPGFLTIELTVPPAARAAGTLLVVEGPGIESVRSSRFEMFHSESTSPQRIVVTGALSTGPIAQFEVPDRGLQALYRVRLLQVSSEDHAIEDLSGYRAVVTR